MSETASGLTDTKRRIVERLKLVGAATAGDLAAHVGLTDAAVRQHLDGLRQLGLVDASAGESHGRGRPPVGWALTDAAAALFPDRHGELTVELVQSIRGALGDDALAAVVAHRAARQRETYRHVVAGGSVAARVTALAEQRTREGYVADVAIDPSDGAIVLTEHHCPIRDAADACGALCQAELDLFRSVLGADTQVERTRHLLAGDSRCAYRIVVDAHAN